MGEMRQSRRSLDRPLIICGGFTDIGIGPAVLRGKLQGVIDDDRILTLSFADCLSIESCRRKLVAAIDERFGRGDNDAETVEVDLIGLSMGGLVAVSSAADLGDGARRVNARRIFTLASPLTGARLAVRAPIAMTQLHTDMRPGSRLYQTLQSAPLDAEIFSYTRLNDQIVGEEFSAMPGHTPWWAPTPPLEGAHLKGTADVRFLADIARRLRNEPAFGRIPPAPLPQ